jgi:hypothetical protein
MEDELSPQRKSFAEAYAATLSAVDAAIAAGYSKKTARSQGSRLLANVSIKKYVDKLLAEKSEGLKLTREALLNELSILALGPGRDGVKLHAIKLAGEAIGLFRSDGSENNGGGKKDKSDAVDAVLELDKKIS